MLDSLEKLLRGQKVRFVRIDGGTPSSVRHELCGQFQSDDDTRVALLSISATYSGLTLTAAQLVLGSFC